MRRVLIVTVCLAATAAIAGFALGGVGDAPAEPRAPLGTPLPAGCDNGPEGSYYCNLNVSVTGPGKVTGPGIDCSTNPENDSQGCYENVNPVFVENPKTVTLTAVPNVGAVLTGWSGDCSGASLTCNVTLPPGRTVTAIFATTPAGCSSSSGGLLCTLTVTVTGPGKVTGPGIDCPGDCTEQVLTSQANPKSISLTATANSGATFNGWSGDCTGTASCNVTLPPGRSVTAAFAEGPAPPTPPTPPAPPPGEQPEIGDTSEPALPDSLPPPGRELEVDLSGNGTVVGRVVASSRSSLVGEASGGAVKIRCGTKAFRCEAKLSPGTVVTFEASPSPGFVFGGWRGPCAGQGTSCRVVLSASRSVSAIFLPKDASSQVQVDLADPSFRVRWKQSVGRGTLLLRGRAAKAATLRVQVRRPGGGPLLSDQVSVPAGAFRRSLSLAPGLLPRGARVLPGGFVVTLTGKSGSIPVGFQLRTVVLPAPPEGVVRNAFVSNSETGKPTSLAAGATAAFAHFVFAAQPAAGQSLTASWYRPDGSLLGSAEKANRPRVFTFIRSGAALPTGVWRAELKAGGKIVKVLRVRIQ